MPEAQLGIVGLNAAGTDVSITPAVGNRLFSPGNIDRIRWRAAGGVAPPRRAPKPPPKPPNSITIGTGTVASAGTVKLA